MASQEILAHLQAMYGVPGWAELDEKYMRLSEPMNRNDPIEVMLKGIEEVHLFLLASPGEGLQQIEVSLISHALIKLSTGDQPLAAQQFARWMVLFKRRRDAL